MLANQEAAQEPRYDPPHQEDVMSSTQELMVPAHNAPSYDAPGGGFSANPKVTLALPETVLSCLLSAGHVYLLQCECLWMLLSVQKVMYQCEALAAAAAWVTC